MRLRRAHEVRSGGRRRYSGGISTRSWTRKTGAVPYGGCTGMLSVINERTRVNALLSVSTTADDLTGVQAISAARDAQRS